MSTMRGPSVAVLGTSTALIAGGPEGETAEKHGHAEFVFGVDKNLVGCQM